MHASWGREEGEMYRQSWGDGRGNGFARQNWPLFQWREAAASPVQN